MAHLPETIAAQIPEFAQCRSPNIEDNPDDLLTRIGRTPASARTCGQSGFNREIRILGCNFDSSDFLEIQPLFLRMWSLRFHSAVFRLTLHSPRVNEKLLVFGSEAGAHCTAGRSRFLPARP